jgi:hypothetical protein
MLSFVSCRLSNLGAQNFFKMPAWPKLLSKTSRALAHIAGSKAALLDYDTELNNVYISRAETLLELAIDYAQERCWKG